MRPLYKSSQDAPFDPDGHRGLWFDKFFDQWPRGNDRWALKADDASTNPKLTWLRSLCKNPAGAKQPLNEAVNRVVRLVGERGRIAVFSTQSRFVTGLGRANPVENGFAWHPTLGTPYLPGSSIKGLVRAWARSCGCEDECERLLGSAKEHHAGIVAFLDAIPTGPVKLEVDVLTPHYANWTTGNPPGDWRSPIPIPFLVTAKGESFLFSLIGCGATPKELETVEGWLHEALAWEGGGAKTAVGYGRFELHEGQTNERRGWLEAERQKRERARVMSTPEGRWRLRVEEWSEGELLNAIRVNLGNGELTDPVERAAFVSAVRTLRAEWLAAWRKGNSIGNINMGPKKLKERARLIDQEP
jgi:CRISPR-associated protein Cmr6